MTYIILPICHMYEKTTTPVCFYVRFYLIVQYKQILNLPLLLCFSSSSSSRKMKSAWRAAKPHCLLMSPLAAPQPQHRKKPNQVKSLVFMRAHAHSHIFKISIFMFSTHTASHAWHAHTHAHIRMHAHILQYSCTFLLAITHN